MNFNTAKQGLNMLVKSGFIDTDIGIFSILTDFKLKFLVKYEIIKSILSLSLLLVRVDLDNDIFQRKTTKVPTALSRCF